MLINKDIKALTRTKHHVKYRFNDHRRPILKVIAVALIQQFWNTLLTNITLTKIYFFKCDFVRKACEVYTSTCTIIHSV